MFGFSVTKILFTAAVIFAVWQGFKWIGRMQRVRDARGAGRKETRAGSGGPAGSGGSGAAASAAQDMLPCPQCGVYVAAGAAHVCGDDNAARPG